MAFTPTELRYLRSRTHVEPPSTVPLNLQHYLSCLFQRPITDDEVVDYLLTKPLEN